MFDATTMGAGEKRPSKSDLEETLSRLASQTPIVEGPMFKQYRSGVGFNKRYFALYDGVLLYYHHQRAYEKEKINGTIVSSENKSSCSYTL